MNANVYMFLSHHYFGKSVGIASTIGGVCSLDKGMKVAITEFTWNNLATAWVKILIAVNQDKLP